MTYDDDGRPMDEVDLLAEKVHLYQGFHAAMIRWDDVSAAAHEAATKDDFLEEIKRLLDVGDKQAEAISEMQVQRVTQDSRTRIKTELQELRAELAQARRERGQRSGGAGLD